MRVLTADIGGTKTALVLFELSPEGPCRLREETFESHGYGGLLPIVQAFMADEEPVAAAGFGVAGPVRDGVCHTTNLPWAIYRSELVDALGTEHVALLNDWQIALLALPDLAADKQRILQRGQRDPNGPIAAIGLGTGLGQAILVPTPGGPVPLATEGGHSDFAPNDTVQERLWARLREEHGRVSVERAVSGSALPNVYRTIIEAGVATENADVTARFASEDPGAVIGKLGVEGSDPACVATVELLIKMLGAEAGNLALKILPTGGLYVGGGSAIKLAPFFDRAPFLQAFLDKGRMRSTLETIPVTLVLEEELGILGALAAAQQLLD